MTTLPISGYMSDNARTQGQMKTAFEAVNSVIREILGGATSGTATIASGAFTLAENIAVVVIDTESAAASDDLTNVTQTTARDGRCMLVKSTSNNRVVVIKNASGGAGQFSTQDGNDVRLDDTRKAAHFRYNAATTTWEEVPFLDRITLNRLLGMAEESSLTIASGAVIPTTSLVELDCESGTADDLDFLTQTWPVYFVIIHTKDTGDTITVRHNQTGSGKILLSDSANASLDSPNKFILLMRKGTTWEEVGRFGFTSAGLSVSSQSGNFSAATGDNMYRCTASLTVTLPTIAAATSTATRLRFFNESAADVTLDGNGSETINGSLTTIVNPGESVQIMAGTSEWKVI